MRKNLVYMRIKTTVVVENTHSVIVIMTKTLRFGGSWKFGITPGGGGPAGPSSKECNASGGRTGDEVAILTHIDTEWNFTTAHISR